MLPPTKLQVLANFDTKNITTLYHPPYSPDLYPPNYFLFPKLKIKLKGLHFADVAEIQEAVSDELKKVQKEEFSTAFQKLYDCAKPLYMQLELILSKKKYVYSSCTYDFLKKISPKTFGPHCVCWKSRRGSQSGMVYRLRDQPGNENLPKKHIFRNVIQVLQRSAVVNSIGGSLPQ